MKNVDFTYSDLWVGVYIVPSRGRSREGAFLFLGRAGVGVPGHCENT